MDFDGINDQSISWERLAGEFVLERRNEYINDFVKKVHLTKKKSEADFKFQLDMLILKAPESRLMTLGCSK